MEVPRGCWECCQVAVFRSCTGALRNHLGLNFFFFGLQGSKVGRAPLIEPICWLSAMRNTPLSPGAEAEKFTVWFCWRIASRTLHKHCPDIGSMVVP